MEVMEQGGPVLTSQGERLERRTPSPFPVMRYEEERLIYTMSAEEYAAFLDGVLGEGQSFYL